MLKWIGKILGGGNEPEAKTPTAAGGAEPSPASAAAAATATARNPGAKPGEVPLPPPKIVIEDDNAGNTAGVSRQVIINREFHAVGYEFVMRDRTRMRVAHLDPQTQKINDQLLVRAINSLGVDKLARFRQIWLSVVDIFVGNPMLESLPAQSTVLIVRLHGHAAPAPELLAQAAAMKEKGYRFALANWVDDDVHRAWLPLANYLIVDVAALNPAEVGDTMRQLAAKVTGLQIVAKQIDSHEEFEFCYRANFKLFHGAFLTKRENWPPQPKMSPQRVRLCQVLNSLRAGEDTASVAEHLRQSPELTYRLLRYINSAGMGLSNRIGSIEQGMVYLGREKLYRWLTLLLFNADDSKSSDGTLLEQALVRARMMELLSTGKLSRVQGDELFVVGVFSLLDILLKLPMSVALDPLQLPDAVASALLRDDGVYAPYLRLATAVETEDAEAIAVAGEALGLTADAVNAAHFSALAWVQETLAPSDAGA